MDFKQIFENHVAPNDEAVIDQLNTSGLPVVMYGASPDVADQIVKKLLLNHITVSCVAYDEDCPVKTASTAYLKDTPTVQIKDIDSQIPAYHVIIGFVKGYMNVDALYPKFRQAKSIAYLSEIFDMEIITRSFVEENSVFF
jgi:hypothetical protein